MKSIGGKAAEFLRKAAEALRGKARVLRARLLFLASLRRRAAVVASISRHIRALSPGQQGQWKAAGGHAMVFSRPADHDADVDDGEGAATPSGTREHDVAVGIAELASLFQRVDEDGDGSYQNWTLALRSMFDDEESRGCGEDEQRAGDGLHGDIEGLEDDDKAPSVIDLIRSRREGEGRGFRIDDEIDQAADMFITSVRRRRMSVQQELL